MWTHLVARKTEECSLTVGCYVPSYNFYFLQENRETDTEWKLGASPTTIITFYWRWYFLIIQSLWHSEASLFHLIIRWHLEVFASSSEPNHCGNIDCSLPLKWNGVGVKLERKEYKFHLFLWQRFWAIVICIITLNSFGLWGKVF